MSLKFDVTAIKLDKTAISFALYRVTNPHEFVANGVKFLGTSGQNVDDIYKYSSQEDRAGILEAILEWGHLVPTAPDTLSSYPFALDDPFLLEDAPHVLFAGNQPEFQSRLIEGMSYHLKFCLLIFKAKYDEFPHHPLFKY